jgi:hypothetical protein
MSQTCSTFFLVAMFGVFQLSVADTVAANEEPEATIPLVLDRSHASLLGVTLESDTGIEITKKLGRSQPTLLTTDGEKDPHHGPYVYCYFSSSRPRVYVQFRTGGSEDPSAYQYDIEKSSKSGKARCSPSPVINEQVQTGGGVRLGISKGEFLRLFPGTPKVTGETLSYHYAMLVKYDTPRPSQWNPSINYTGEWHYSDVRALFSNSKLIRLSVSMTGEMDW